MTCNPQTALVTSFTRFKQRARGVPKLDVEGSNPFARF